MAVVAAAPNEDLAFLGAGQGVVFAPRYVADRITSQRLDDGRSGDNRIRIPPAGGNPSLPEVIRAPGIQLFLLGDGEGVVRTACYLGDGR